MLITRIMNLLEADFDCEVDRDNTCFRARPSMTYMPVEIFEAVYHSYDCEVNETTSTISTPSLYTDCIETATEYEYRVVASEIAVLLLRRKLVGASWELMNCKTADVVHDFMRIYAKEMESHETH